MPSDKPFFGFSSESIVIHEAFFHVGEVPGTIEDPDSLVAFPEFSIHYLQAFFVAFRNDG